LEAKTTLLFVGGTEKETEEFLEFLFTFLDKYEEDTALARSLLRCYSLLLSTFPPSKISNYFLPFHIGKIFEIARTEEEVRLVLISGEVIAQILSSHRSHLLKENGAEKINRKFFGETEWEWAGLDGYIDIDDLTYILETKYRSNATPNQTNNRYLKQVYKSMMKQTLPYIDTPIKIRSTLIELNDWSKLVQMRFFKEILDGSWYLHLQYNDLFSQVFDYNLFEDHVNRPSSQSLARDRKENEKNRDNERKFAEKVSLKSQTNASFRDFGY